MKHIKYILILIILVGIFSPIIKARAAGQCTVTVAGGYVAFQGQTTTRAECEAKKNVNGSNGNWTWVETPANANKGCSIPEFKTKEECEGKGTWIEQTASVDKRYTLLAPLPCDPNANPPVPGCDRSTKTIKTFDPASGLGVYLNLMIKIFIGLCAVLSVVMIVLGGIEYMTSELVHSKEAGKEKIIHALLGLLLALGAYALLYTINPDLLKSEVTIPTGTCSAPEFTTLDDCSGKGIWTPSL